MYVPWRWAAAMTHSLSLPGLSIWSVIAFQTTPGSSADGGAGSPRTLAMVRTNGSHREKLELVKKCGFAGVEIDSPGTPNLDELAKASKDTGVAVHGVIDNVHWNPTHVLSHPDEKVRADMAIQLGRLRALRAVDSLDSTLVRDPSPTVRDACARSADSDDRPSAYVRDWYAPRAARELLGWRALCDDYEHADLLRIVLATRQFVYTQASAIRVGVRPLARASAL